MGEYYRTIRVGEVDVTAILDANAWFPMKNALDLPESEWRPVVETDDRDRLPITILAVHLALPGRSVLVDTGVGEPTEENVRLERWLEVVRTPGVDGWLAAQGLTRDAIDLVGITHAHGDHIAGAVVEREGRFQPRFPRARYVLGAADYHNRAGRASSGEAINRWLDGLTEAGAVDLVDRETEIAPGLSFVSAPGESPGHGLFRLASAGQVLYLVGDLFHHPIEISRTDWMPPRRDRPKLQESRRMLIDRALAEDALVLPTHFPFPGAGRVRKTAPGVTWEAIA